MMTALLFSAAAFGILLLAAGLAYVAFLVCSVLEMGVWRWYKHWSAERLHKRKMTAYRAFCARHPERQPPQ